MQDYHILPFFLLKPFRSAKNTAEPWNVGLGVAEESGPGGKERRSGGLSGPVG